MVGRVLHTADFTNEEELDVVTNGAPERRLAEAGGAIRLAIKDLRSELIDRNESDFGPCAVASDEGVPPSHTVYGPATAVALASWW
jgi:hypothetical protein